MGGEGIGDSKAASLIEDDKQDLEWQVVREREAKGRASKGARLEAKAH
jgi:hypothetical protein